MSLYGDTIIQPTTDPDTSDPFTVNERSQILYIYPSTGTTITENDAFALERETASGQFIPVVEKDGAVLLGANRTEFDLQSRGTFRLNKTASTTESMGARRLAGMEEL